MKPRLAIVVQRYGNEVLGGAEQHARIIAELLKDDCDVTVLTTTAKDYITWAEYYPASRCEVNDLPVIRFPVERERDIHDFNRRSDLFFAQTSKTLQEEDEWFTKQGPYCPKLLDYLEQEKESYDCFLFFTYLYYPTVYGVPLVSSKSLIVPTSHNEAPFYLKRIEQLFNNLAGIIFNTGVEREFVGKNYDISTKKIVVSGVCIDPPVLDKVVTPSRKNRYILYFGRIEEGKGVFELMDFFQLLKTRYPDLDLVCLGNSSEPIARPFGVDLPGFVPEEEKWGLILEAEFVVVPSAMESLSMTLLESFVAGKPALVNGRSDVMVEHCIRSGGGLWYENANQFLESADMLLKSRDLRTKMGLGGQRYVLGNYSREVVRKKHVDMIAAITGN